jgi:hypothetical protein
MTIRNRDARSPSNLTLDSLQAHEIAAYRSGEWLAPPRVTSEQLQGRHRPNDTELMAELSARLLLAAEQLENEDEM